MFEKHRYPGRTSDQEPVPPLSATILTLSFLFSLQMTAPADGTWGCNNETPLPGEEGVVGPNCDIRLIGIDTPDAVKAEIVVVQGRGRDLTGMKEGEWACWYMQGYDGRHLIIQASRPFPPGEFTLN